MKLKNLFHQGTPNSFSVDISELLDEEKYSFLVDKSIEKEYYFNDYTSLYQVQEAYKHFKIDKKQKDDIVPINEITARDIRKGADKARLLRSRDRRITCHFQGVTPARGWIKFLVTSQYTPGKKYTVYIKLKEAKNMKYFKEFKREDIIKLFLTGDLQLFCSCKDFQFRFKHMSWSMGYGLFKELRYPHIANPRLEGTVCKHCLACLAVLNMNGSRIAKAMKASKFFKKKMEEDEYANK